LFRAPQTYYLHRDYLGSITQITDNSRNLVAEYSYDAWGQMRNPVNWQNYTLANPALPMSFGGRGYTGHEQLNQFGLINMNARLYDPLLARFLAPDPFVGSGMANDFNRYIYCKNNPLMFTDPSGKSWKSFWSDFGNAFVRDFKRTFGGVNGFEIGYNSNGGGFGNALRGGSSFGPSIGISNSGQITTGNSQGGIHQMQSVNLESKLQQSVSIAEYDAKVKYSNGMAIAYSFGSVFNSITTGFKNWTSKVETAGSMFMDWGTGLGEQTRTFKNDNVTDEMQDTPGVNKARDYFYNKYKDVTNLDGASLTKFRSGFFGPVGAYNVGFNPIQQFVGGFQVDIHSDGESLYFRIYNKTSVKSFPFEIGPEWEKFNFPTPGGNMYQYYFWKEPIKYNR